MLKFHVPRLETGIERYDPASTSNRHAEKSISIQLTRSGNVLISGTTGHFATTHKTMKAVNKLLYKYLLPFVLETP